MDITPLSQIRVDVANLPLDQVANNTRLSETEKVGQACKAFEAVLLRQILAEGQKPMFASKYVENSTTSDIYRDMVVTQLAESISRSGSFGLAKTLSGELQRQTLDSVKTTTPANSSAAAFVPSKS